MRPLLVILHRYVGLATALFLIVVGLTGALLAWLEPLEAALSPELHAAPGRGAVLSPVELRARALAAEPRAAIEGWPVDYEEGKGVSFFVLPAKPAAGAAPAVPLGYDQLWLDPVTGAVLGRVDTTAFPPTRQSLMRFVYRLHYQLALPGRWGLWIMGGVALLWFFDCFVGAWLTLPRGRPLLRKWRPAWGVQRRRLGYDLHRAGGLWPWLLLATLALSGVYFNLRQEVFLPLFDRIATRTVEPYDSRPADYAMRRGSPAQVSAEQALQIAEDRARALGWQARPEYLSHPRAQGFWHVYFEKPKAQWATAGASIIDLDDASGEVLLARAPHGRAGDVFLDWLVALHLGLVFGTPYRVLLSLTGLATALLSVTGVVIWWRKRRVRHGWRRNARPVAAASEPAGPQTLRPLRPPA